MSVPEWFAVGVGAAGALWWWRCLVQWITWSDVDGKPVEEPSAFWGIVGGTIAWAFSPVWVPIYAGHQVWTGQVHVLREFGRRTNRALLKAFPERK